MDFIMNNLSWFIAGSVILVLAIIGYITDKNEKKQENNKMQNMNNDYQNSEKQSNVQDIYNKSDVQNLYEEPIQYKEPINNIDVPQNVQDETNVETPNLNITQDIQDQMIDNTPNTNIENNITAPISEFNNVENLNISLEDLEKKNYNEILDKKIQEEEMLPDFTKSDDYLDETLATLNIAKEETPNNEITELNVHTDEQIQTNNDTEANNNIETTNLEQPTKENQNNMVENEIPSNEQNEIKTEEPTIEQPTEENQNNIVENEIPSNEQNEIKIEEPTIEQPQEISTPAEMINEQVEEQNIENNEQSNNNNVWEFNNADNNSESQIPELFGNTGTYNTEEPSNTWQNIEKNNIEEKESNLYNDPVDDDIWKF